MDISRRNFMGAGFGVFAATGLNAFGAAPKDGEWINIPHVTL